MGGRISRAHNLQRERTFVPLRVNDPINDTERRCEHFAEYGSAAHALSYFRGNENIPAVCNPILAALLKEEAVTSLGENRRRSIPLAHRPGGERRDHGHLDSFSSCDHGVRAASGPRREREADAYRG